VSVECIAGSRNSACFNSERSRKTMFKIIKCYYRHSGTKVTLQYRQHTEHRVPTGFCAILYTVKLLDVYVRLAVTVIKLRRVIFARNVSRVGEEERWIQDFGKEA
jgi:hypothetical protein